MTTRGINGTVARPWCKISDDSWLYYLALIIILFEGDVRRRWRSTIRGSRSRRTGGIILDDDGDNGEDDGDIKLPSTQTIHYCNCFDNFFRCGKFPPRETTIAVTMVT